jgi:hypothetical protein
MSLSLKIYHSFFQEREEAKNCAPYFIHRFINPRHKKHNVTGMSDLPGNKKTYIKLFQTQDFQT